jgi:broad specificity phosphatase PhoE
MTETNYISREPIEGETEQPLTYTMPEDWMEKQKRVDAWIEEYRMKNPGVSTRNIRRALERNFKNILK